VIERDEHKTPPYSPRRCAPFSDASPLNASPFLMKEHPPLPICTRNIVIAWTGNQDAYPEERQASNRNRGYSIDSAAAISLQRVLCMHKVCLFLHKRKRSKEETLTMKKKLYLRWHSHSHSRGTFRPASWPCMNHYLILGRP